MAEYHFFSPDAFLRLLAELRFPGATPTIVRCDDVVVRALVQRGRAISDVWNLPISLRPIEDAAVHPEIEVPYLSHVVRHVAEAEDTTRHGTIAAPFVRWS